MQNDNKCKKYEALFIFKDEEAFNEHIETCEDCKQEHEKYLKVSQLVKSVADDYIKLEQKRKSNKIKSMACCFAMFVSLVSFSGYQMYDDYSFQISNIDNSYIDTNLGLPVDEYGFLEI